MNEVNAEIAGLLNKDKWIQNMWKSQNATKSYSAYSFDQEFMKSNGKFIILKGLIT